MIEKITLQEETEKSIKYQVPKMKEKWSSWLYIEICIHGQIGPVITGKSGRGESVLVRAKNKNVDNYVLALKTNKKYSLMYKKYAELKNTNQEIMEMKRSNFYVSICVQKIINVWIKRTVGCD